MIFKSIRTHLKEIGINTRNWVDLTQNRDYWRALVNAALNLQVPYAMELVIEIGRYRGIMSNEHIRICSNSYEKLKIFKYLGSLLTNQNYIHEEIKCRLKAGNSC